MTDAETGGGVDNDDDDDDCDCDCCVCLPSALCRTEEDDVVDEGDNAGSLGEEMHLSPAFERALRGTVCTHVAAPEEAMSIPWGPTDIEIKAGAGPGAEDINPL